MKVQREERGVEKQGGEGGGVRWCMSSSVAAARSVVLAAAGGGQPPPSPIGVSISSLCPITLLIRCTTQSTLLSRDPIQGMSQRAFHTSVPHLKCFNIRFHFNSFGPGSKCCVYGSSFPQPHQSLYAIHSENCRKTLIQV